MSTADQEPIAVIGMACRFPGGSNTPSKLWDLLKSPRNIAKPVPTDRFDVTGFFHPNGSHHGATDCTEAYFLDEDVTRFDNAFFNIQPGEAEALDPQQRFLMETIYDSLCSAGQTIEGLRGSRAAVYVGLMCDDWAQMSSRDWDVVPTYAATGTSRAVVSNRVSYFFDWHGPSMTIDTACSSSLVAVHEGVNILRRGESPIVVAAGTNLILSPGMMIAESNLHMLSPTGRSKMWDASADGYARGEGVAAVVLKKLSDALRDGDPIECVIRGTGVNQDGKTPGITMPNNVAQADLIRDTYASAGLNVNDPKDRPQFFHAHGTGTPAGDPQEAEAISRAFYDGGSVNDPLFVGSIKTVIGHTEGTAGLASLIGTCLAMQHSTIPPNLHFNTLSDRVAEFCAHLRVPTEALPWPKPVSGQPRRASVNSFGFGGTNAHAIIESFEAPPAEKRVNGTTATAVPAFTPLTISAASSSALRTTLTDLRTYIQTHPDANLRDLAYTFQHRRSTLAFRKAIACKSLEDVATTIDALLGDDGAEETGLTSRYFDSQSPRVLGVFTGQGAQWPRMAAQLLEKSPYASERIAQLDHALATLPKSDRPDWTLRDQILADASQSRLSEAALSQPLCTAVQIVLVDLLRLANIKLHGVVGHSSGEIAAAYAAGFLSASDAIRIAYYRGLYAKLAGSPSGRGSMLAVGTSFEDASEFCELDEFAGRIQVAARNSSNSVTLSGDEDAIEEALAIYKDEGKFARQLRVDTAYHSHHMQPCAGPYVDALTRCNINVGEGNGIPWFSSVVEGHVMSKQDVQPQYWVDNMVSAVMFSPAVTHAVAEGGPFDLGLELGPHPALKGPCLDTIEEVAGHRIPYTGLLGRGKNDLLELSSALGFVWTQLGAGSVDFDQFEKGISGDLNTKRVVGDLPSYPFDHSRSFYTVTRFSGGHRNLHEPPNPVLGRRLVESETADEVSWRNILRSGEISWLQGHQLQGQTVFPAMGYVAMGVEAAAVLAGANRPLGLFTLEDVVIGRALAFSSDSVGMESKVTVKIDRFSDTELHGNMSVHSGLPYDNAPLSLNFSATIHALFHEPQPDTLAAVRTDEIDLVNCKTERLYAQFTQLGYNYSPPFTGVRQIHRKSGFAAGEIEDVSGEGWEDQLIVHPGWLDCALQTAFAAYSYPQDNRLWALNVPTEIRSLTINPYFTARGAGGRSRQLQYESTAREGPNAPIVADIDVFAGEGQSHAFVQIEGVQVKPFAAAGPRDDAPLFARFDYQLAEPDAVAAVAGDDLMPPQTEAVIDTIERVGFFYLRRVHETITPAEREATLPHFQHLIDYCGRVVPQVAAGKHPHVPAEAISDSPAYIRSLLAKDPTRADFQLIEAVGENLVLEIRRRGTILEHMMKDGVLDRFYEEMAGLDIANVWIARLVAQVTHRHPHLRIFEIGAGTGGTTRTILPMLGDAFKSYTFTDISAGFFERGQERFRSFADRMVFATYNMDLTPEEQGFEEGSYDVVVASNVLHATGKLDVMMANTRRLLRPGGYLMMLEFISNDRTGITACVGGLPGWWGNGKLDPNGPRRDGPCLTRQQWDTLVRRHGFAGIDSSTPVEKHLQWYAVHLCQAVDDRVLSLRDPLGAPAVSEVAPAPSELVIVGGTTAAVARLADQASELLGSRYGTITRLDTLEELNDRGLAFGCSVLSLTELDQQYLELPTESKMEALKVLLTRAGGSILWVTRGVRDASPYSAMILGLARVVRYENTSINLQVLDFDVSPSPHTVAENLIRLEMGSHWKDQGVNILNSVEPEVHYEKGQVFIPRMYPDSNANARYNTQRRTVTKEVDPRETPVVLEPTPSGDTLELCTPSPLRVALPPRPGTVETVELRVEQSVLHAIKIPKAGFFSLCAGTNTSTGQPLLALVDTPVESCIRVPAEWTVVLREPASADFLRDVASRLVAKAILAAAPRFGSLLVHEVDDVLKDGLSWEAARDGAHVVFTTALAEKTKADPSWILVHEKLPTRLAQKLLPPDVSGFADWSHSSATAQLLARCVPVHTPTTTAQDLVRTRPGALPDAASQDIGAALQAASQAASRKRRVASQNNVQALPLKDVSHPAARHAPLTIVDWNTPSVEVALRPIDAGRIFRPDGTYFLVGLSGEVGQSLCRWMVAHGARNVVLSSRRPKVHPRYIESIEAMGATIRVVGLDLTKRDAVHECIATIRAEMPPIIGIANGALLLEDSMFDKFNFEAFQRTAPCKVEGSAVLDEIFFDAPLDFFILFTSVANIVGNVGQSAYVMANQFMTSLASQRRDIRGVVGSAIAISSVQGLGYLEHSEVSRETQIRLGYRNISEQDLHQLFAEAVLAGRPGYPGVGEVVTFMSPFRDSPEIQANLRLEPKFRHYILQQNDAGDSNRAGGVGGGGKTVRPRVRLAKVKSQAEAFSVVLESLTESLKRILMMPATETIDPLMSLVELGIDSIMAVDLRTWFLKELEVDVPVLKILGPGETVKSRAEDAMEKIPASIVDLTKLEAGTNTSTGNASAPPTQPVQPSREVGSVDVKQTSESSTLTPSTTSTRTTASESPDLIPTPGTSLEKSGFLEDKQLYMPPGKAQAMSDDGSDWRKAMAHSSVEHVEQMTFGQRRFWFLSHYVEDPTTFNIAYLGKLTGRLRVDDLAKAVEKAAQRHETLRTRFFWSPDDSRTPMQGILSQTLVRLETATIETEAQALQELEAMRKYEWNLGDWVPLRMRLLSLSDTIHYLILGSHHISMDGHSFSVLLLDINQQYNSPSRQLPPLPDTSQARAFGAHQVAAYESGQLRPAIEHYRSILPAADLARPIELFPFARTQVRPPLDSYGTHVARVHLEPETTAKLKQLARGRRATSFHTYLAALQALLFRLLPADTTERVYIGIADANRLDERFTNSVGNFLNVLPLRFDRERQQTFGKAVETARDKARDALRHSALPFDLLLDEVNVPRSNAWAPVFQVFMNYRLVVKEHAEKRWVGCQIGEEKWHTARTGYDVALEIVEDHQGATLAMHVQRALYDADAANLLVRSFAHAVREFAKQGDSMATEKLGKWDKVDVEKALEIGKGPALKLEWPATVAHRIDEVISQHPGSVALKDGLGNVLTYAEMDGRVEAISRALRDQLSVPRHGQNPIVGVFQAPSADWICSLLAIHRIGAVYLPLDLRNSIPRLKSNVQVARPAAILTDAETSGRTTELGVPKDTVAIIDVSKLAARTETKTVAAAKSNEPAYIIFTSGSTGEPKGIVVTHAGLRANLEGYHRAWNIPALAGVVLQNASFGFDASLLQIYAALTTGGCLLVVPADARGDPAEVTRMMVEHGVTMTQATPSEYEMWFRFAPDELRRCTSWKAAWFGGERAAPGLVSGFRELCKALPGLSVYTSYGPTETTISAMKGVADVRNDPNLTVPVPGRLLPNYAAFIVDEEMQPLPIGVPGEILLGGDGVGNNKYLHRPDLTERSFLSNPFPMPNSGSNNSGRMYRTGDYGRLDKSGLLAIESRIAGDTQVKLRGFRIELTEIERVMLREAEGQLAQVVVTLRGGDGQEDDGFLAAHVVFERQDAKDGPNSREVIDRLQARLPLSLPQYMCPAVIVSLDEVPLTTSAKVDRRALQALPLPETVVSSGGDIQHLRILNPTEDRLSRLWAGVLPHRAAAADLGPRSDFFAAGGHSLLLVKLQAAIKREFGDAPRLSKLMSATELGSMAALLEKGVEELDWDKETALDLPPIDASIPTTSKRARGNAGLRILVTGATGSLGRRIVRRLAREENVAKIVCLVRPADGRDPATLFPGPENGKVQVVLADLPSLPADQAEVLDIDAVLHCAADRSFWDGYGAVKPVNVDTLKALVSLALRAGAHLHSLSSGALAAFEDPDDTKVGESGNLPRPSAADGYMASKWVAERYLARAARVTGLQVTAHRPTEAPGAAPSQETEILTAMAGDMLSLSASLGVRPNFAGLSGTIDVGRLEDVACAVAAEVTSGSGSDSRSLSTVSYPGLARVHIKELATFAERLLTKADADSGAMMDLPSVPALHWVGLAKRAGLFEWLLTAQHLIVEDDEGRKIVSNR